MGARTITVYEDSFDGKDLKEDEVHKVNLSLGRRSWELTLSEKNAEKFYSELEKWTQNEPEQAAQTFTAARKSPQRSTATRDVEQTRAIREWAQSTNQQYKGKPIGDRGRIPQEVVDAYNAAN